MDSTRVVDWWLDVGSIVTALRDARGSRIVGTAVLPLLPRAGPVYVLLLGEAPGPRGADKSGVPFFGDAAGKHLYAVLRRMHAIELPARIDTLPWDGATFAAASLAPVAHGVALGNAYDRCPTENGTTFRAPNRGELEGLENIARLTQELVMLRARGLRGIVTLGRVAMKTMDVVLTRTPMDGLTRRAMAHPSAQGLLSMAPDRGRGAKMVDLIDAWQIQCERAIIEAGFLGVGPEVIS